MTSIKRRKPEEIIARLRKMQSFDADIPKDCADAAKYQRCADVACRDLEMQEQYADRPIITMSMAKTGVISRLAGEVFGSAAALVR